MRFLSLISLPLALSLTLSACASNPLSAVKTFSYKGGIHQEGQVTYTEHPPVGGAHNPHWQRCGVYDKPLYEQYAVHSMEHGAVWVTYQPSLAAADVEKLKTAVQGHAYTLLSPYPGQSTPVVLSAWNTQLPLDSVDAATIGTFLAKYEQGPTAPEHGAPCDGPFSVTETQ
jgi:hypothetical protein